MNSIFIWILKLIHFDNICIWWNFISFLKKLELIVICLISYLRFYQGMVLFIILSFILEFRRELIYLILWKIFQKYFFFYLFACITFLNVNVWLLITIIENLKLNFIKRVSNTYHINLPNRQFPFFSFSFPGSFQSFCSTNISFFITVDAQLFIIY